MNKLEIRLEKLSPGLLAKFQETLVEVELLLTKYDSNFPSYTDHSIKHTKEVFQIASQLLTPGEIEDLNSDEIYVLSMACILHDIGMCIPPSRLAEVSKDRFGNIPESDDPHAKEDLIRDIHHELSFDFIVREHESLRIPNDRYAQAIALVAKGHRKVALDDNEMYPSKFFVKNGRDFVCLPYLASVLRLADELDITNIRTPKLLTKYYMPNNERSIREWQKHIATTQVNFTEDKIIFEVSCSDQNTFAALEEQFYKIEKVANYSQKIIRNISNTEERHFSLKALQIIPKYTFVGFDPKGIKFSFDVDRVVETFIGEDLYKGNLAAVREAIQNAIDSCRYKKSILQEAFEPEVSIQIFDSHIEITDNGLGMDEFVVENFFGRLGSSFYEQEKVKRSFEAIGQFGVGVFSYFLLGEYIDVETKTEKGKPLKFRIDKDPKNYFHFFEPTDRTTAGTTLTLYFKKDIMTKYSSLDYVNYIINNFRYIEFPILITRQDEQLELKARPFSLDSKIEIDQRILPQFKNMASKFQLICHHHTNEEFDGFCGIIIPIFDPKFSLIGVKHFFDPEAFDNGRYTYNTSELSISQKGVFVRNYNSESMMLIVGSVNLKKAKKIDISRGEFSNSESIQGVITNASAGLIDKLFGELRLRYKEDELVKISNDFLSEYITSHIYSPDNRTQIIDKLQENIRLKIYSGRDDTTVLLKDIDADEFILLSGYENYKEVYDAIKMPIVVATGYSYQGSYPTLKSIFNELNFRPKTIIFEKKGYHVLIKADKKEFEHFQKRASLLQYLTNYELNEVQEIESNVIAINSAKYKKELRRPGITNVSEIIINLNHPFVEYILLNFENIKQDRELLRIIRNAFNMIGEICLGRNRKNEIKKLTAILAPMSKFGETFTFSERDFSPS